MKEDLIKVLNFKLKSITNNIDALNDIHAKMDDENAELKFVQNAINNFKGKERGFDIYNFVSIDRETFNKLLMELDDSVLKVFGTNSCNYDGLIYLIKGINDGISLSLTQEQIDAINLFIDKLLEKEKDYQEVLQNLNADKQKLEITDLNLLKEYEKRYALILDEIKENKYVLDIDSVIEALVYGELSKEKTFDLLCYLLEYNASIYEKDEMARREERETAAEIIRDITREVEEKVKVNIPVETEDDDKKEDNVKKEKLEDTKPSEDEDDRLSISSSSDVDKTIIIPPLNAHAVNESNEEIKENLKKVNDLLAQNESLNKEDEVDHNEYDDIVNANLLKKVNEKLAQDEELEEEPKEEPKEENLVSELPHVAELEEVKEEDNKDEEDESFDDFDDLTKEDYEDYDPVVPLQEPLNEAVAEQELESIKEPSSTLKTSELDETDTLEEEPKEEVHEEKVDSEKLSADSVRSLLNEYTLNYDDFDDVNKELLLRGDLDRYKAIFESLKELGVLGLIEKNNELVAQLLIYSSKEVIDEIVKIIGESLSVDEEDKKITTNIVFKTMPSIFIKGDNGNYDNFVKNIASLREYGVDLINLFDFSREVLVASHDLIVNNYNIVRNYDLTINAHNAKYLLLLKDVHEKMDYYVEAVYKETLKGSRNETFDGIDLIKLYPNKLNVVTDETIKRLRYASLHGRKVFGSKEKSLSGEITNLKVDVINMPEDYLKNFFNNEFDIISRDNFIKYQDLVSNNDYVEMKEDELLEKLEKYRNGIRYIIEDVDISRPKVLRNYNILRENGVEKTEALLFAVCYNLVITKEQYEKLKDVIKKLGGE